MKKMFVMLVLLMSLSAFGAVIFESSGGADPATAGFTFVSSGTVTKGSGNDGEAHWYVNTTYKGHYNNTGTMTAADFADPSGWTFTIRTRMLAANLASYQDNWWVVRDGTTRWDLLAVAGDGVNPVGTYALTRTGWTVVHPTLDLTQYHTYQIVYDPTGDGGNGTSFVYIDGVLIESYARAHCYNTTAMEIRGGDQGGVNTGFHENKYALIRFETGQNVVPSDDTTSPSPDPTTWSSVPSVKNNSSISMTATTASDINGVQYYFAETSGNPGGDDSNWQNESSYTDTGLDICTTYTYRVKTRDKTSNHNETVWSTEKSATTGTSDAQSLEMPWHKGLGTDTEEKSQYVLQTSDGGYLVVGMTDEAAGSASDMLIIKADADGDEQWQKIIGTTNQHDWANISAEVSDGYIVAGALSDSGDQERGIVKLDFDGNIVPGWPKTYHKDRADAIRGIDITSDGSIVATGYVGGSEYGYLFICDSGNGSIMMTDAEGNLQWDKILPSTMHGMRVEEVAGGFAIGGNQWVYSNGLDHQDVALVLTDSDGNETHHHYFGGSGNDQCFDFVVTSDGGYIFAGHSTSYGVNWDYYLLKVGSDRNEQWHRTFGQPRGYDANYIHDEAYGVQQTPDGGYIIAGGSGDEYLYSESGHPAGPSDEWKAYLVKTDADGNVQWQGVYPPESEGNNAAEHINLTSDGGYIVCTDSDSASGPPPNNFGLMKISPGDINPADYLCPKGVDFIDYSFFADYWMEMDCSVMNDCNGTDLDFSETVDIYDLCLFSNYWLSGK